MEMVNAILVLSVNKLTDDPINDNEKTRKSFLSTSSIHSIRLQDDFLQGGHFFRAGTFSPCTVLTVHVQDVRFS